MDSPQPLNYINRRGFALILSLILMAFMLMLLLSLSTLLLAETQYSQSALKREIARQNARFGLKIALGQLQELAGPDQRISASASIESKGQLAAPQNKNWIGIYHSDKDHPKYEQRLSASNSKSGWLISEAEKKLNPILFDSDSIIDKTTGLSNDPDYTVLLGRGSVGYRNGHVVKVNTDDFVVAPLLRVNVNVANTVATENQTISRYAWWIGDEGTKANASIINRIDYNNEKQNGKQLDYAGGDLTDKNRIYQSLLKQQQSLRFGIEKIISGLNPDSSLLISDKLLKLITINDLEHINPNNDEYQKSLKKNFKNITTHSYSLLTDTANGGLKINLTDPGYKFDDPRYTHVFNEGYIHFLTAWDDKFKKTTPKALIQTPNPGSNLHGGNWADYDLWHSGNAADSRPRSDEMKTHFGLTLKPIVTEFAFKMGPFHARSDNKHRIRFHIELELWNPYPFPIELNPSDDSREYYAMLAPMNPSEQFNLIIRNNSTTPPSQFSVDLFNFDEALSSNDYNESAILSWINIPNNRLEPGEVYRILVPRTYNDPSSLQIRGLARTIGDSAKPGPPASPDNRWKDWEMRNRLDADFTSGALNTISPSDSIELRFIPPPSGMAFRLLPFLAEIPNDTTPDYRNHPIDNRWHEDLQPFLEIRFDLNTTNNDVPPKQLRGDIYSRATSSSYTIADYKFGMHARLRDDLPIDHFNLRTLMDLRQPIIDLRAPNPDDVYQSLQDSGLLYDISTDPWVVAVSNSDFDGTDVFHDTNEGFNHINSNGPRFLYEFPYLSPGDGNHYPLTSIGQLLHLPIAKARGPSKPKRTGLAIGNPWGKELNGLFDKYFYTGLFHNSWSDNDTTQDLPIPRMLVIDRQYFKNSLEDALNSQANVYAYSDVAQSILIQGGFNINSTSVKAWEAFLASSVNNWQWGDDGESHDFDTAFFNMPFTARDLIQESNNNKLLKDSDFKKMSKNTTPEQFVIESYKQGARDLDTDYGKNVLKIVAEKIVETLIARGKPYTSLEEFLTDGVLHNALLRESLFDNDPENTNDDDPDINEVGIGRMIAPFSPAHINQGTIASASASFMQTRSDTFLIRSYGESLNPISGKAEAKAWMEAIVQRMPELVIPTKLNLIENATGFGRRFKIISIRWLNEEDV